ncbi:DUF4919 domain-containing protein [Dyella sp.]|uniref:DUF4919 domain-containing protein n=1 Tax=Dyella sp. TaxID=1869338 RepID=UPI002ED60476
MRSVLVFCLLCLGLAQGVQAESALYNKPIGDPAMVNAFKRERERLVTAKRINLQQVSDELLGAIHSAQLKLSAHNTEGAMADLKALERYAPLDRFPSEDLQILRANIYQQMGDTKHAEACNTRALSMHQLMHSGETGTGATPDDPVRIIMNADMIEWLHALLATNIKVDSMLYQGAQLQRASYKGLPDKTRLSTAYFKLDPRVAAAKPSTIFTPIPDSKLSPDQKQFVGVADERRKQFLADRSFKYPALVSLYRAAELEATQLDAQGRADLALAALKKIERVRPIESIPVVDLIGFYSGLLGKVGQTDKQAQMTLFYFGILQDIARTGDGESPATAVHVIATSEEYSWVNARQLQVTQQSSFVQGPNHYDRLDTIDAQGIAHAYFFDTTEFAARAHER